MKTETMITSKKPNWKPRQHRRFNKRNCVQISRREIENAMRDFFRKGGKITKMKVDDRMMKNILIHFEDSYL